jgi:hypothetical protein
MKNEFHQHAALVTPSTRGRPGRKKRGTFLGCRKVDIWLPQPERNRKYTFLHPRRAGLSGQKSIKRTQKFVVLGVLGTFSLRPMSQVRPTPSRTGVRQNIKEFINAENVIGEAYSFEDRSRNRAATFFVL